MPEKRPACGSIRYLPRKAKRGFAFPVEARKTHPTGQPSANYADANPKYREAARIGLARQNEDSNRAPLQSPRECQFHRRRANPPKQARKYRRWIAARGVGEVKGPWRAVSLAKGERHRALRPPI